MQKKITNGSGPSKAAATRPPMGVSKTWQQVQYGLMTARKTPSVQAQAEKARKNLLLVEAYMNAIIDWAYHHTRSKAITRDQAVNAMIGLDSRHKPGTKPERHYREMWHLFVSARFIRPLSAKAYESKLRDPSQAIPYRMPVSYVLQGAVPAAADPYDVQWFMEVLSANSQYVPGIPPGIVPDEWRKTGKVPDPAIRANVRAFADYINAQHGHKPGPGEMAAWDDA